VAYYLGIDGGGSKTTCAVGDEDSVIATAVAGASNIVRVGETEARRSLHQAIAQACVAAGISPQQVTRACIGAAGAASADVVATIRRIVAEIVSAEVVVTGDMEIALEAAFASGAGIIVIAGTGSIAYGRDAQGNVVRAGGWGFAVSDEGSAHWIGRNAVAAIFRALDAGRGNRLQNVRKQGGLENDANVYAPGDFPLFDAVRQSWNISSMDELVSAANSTPAPNFAGLFPGIVACADTGDELSRDILTCAGGKLAQLVAVVITNLFPRIASAADSSAAASLASDSAHVRLAMVGGVFRHSILVREVFYNEVRKLDSRVSVLQQVVEPVQGALSLARSGLTS
jgi:glucosamine kinase